MSSETHLPADLRGLNPDSFMQAILFSYFELLLLEANVHKIEKEKSRMEELTNTIALLGEQYMELFAGEMDEILAVYQKLEESIGDGTITQEQSLKELAAFFDSDNAPHAMYMLRVSIRIALDSPWFLTPLPSFSPMHTCGRTRRTLKCTWKCR